MRRSEPCCVAAMSSERDGEREKEKEREREREGTRDKRLG